jgi:putative transposase
MRNAYEMNNCAEAKAALEKIFQQLERNNPSAARSLEEGLEETLTVHRLGIGGVLRRKLATTNPIESCLSTVQRVARNVKRWREGNQPAALDCYRTLGGREKVPTDQRLSRNSLAE